MALGNQELAPKSWWRSSRPIDSGSVKTVKDVCRMKYQWWSIGGVMLANLAQILWSLQGCLQLRPYRTRHDASKDNQQTGINLLARAFRLGYCCNLQSTLNTSKLLGTKFQLTVKAAERRVDHFKNISCSIYATLYKHSSPDWGIT